MNNILRYLFLFFLFYFFINSSLSKAEITSNFENIEAISAVVLDGSTGKILFAKNPHLKIPPASTVKLVTAMVVLDRLPLSKMIVISKNASQTPSVSPELYEGEIYTVRDLLYLMLMKSSNQAAVALAEAVAGSEENFSVLMNKKIYSLGLRNSHFVTSSGLPASNQYTTSYELAIIFYEALKYPLIKEIINTPIQTIISKNGRVLIIENTNKLLDDPELGNHIIGGKTGFTRASKHCLVNGVFLQNKLLIISILGSPSRQSLWKDAKNLIDFAKLVINNKITPIYMTTVTSTNILVSKKLSSKNCSKRYAKKYHKKFYVSKKNHKRIVKKSKKFPLAKTNKIRSKS